MRALAKIMDFLRAVSILLVVMHLYWYCYEAILAWGVNIGVVDRILMNFDRTAGLFRSMLYTKLFALVLLALSCLGTKGVKNEKITWTRIWTVLGAGIVLFFLNWWILELPLPVIACTSLYTLTLASGYVCLLMAGTWMSRLLRTNLMDDVFNNENESFMQETRLIENEYSVNLPTRFYYRKRWNEGWINIINPFRASIVLGTPGSGKSYAVVNSYIKQQIEKGYAMYIYDFKFPDLSTIAYNHLMNHLDGYGVKPRFYVINFDDPRRSHRCNPIHPDFMEDITDAYESAYTIMLNLNRTWVQKQGDFFVESPIILFAAIIWYPLRGDYLVPQNLSGREILHLPARRRVPEQAVRGHFPDTDKLSGTGELPFPVHGCLARRCRRAASGADSLSQDSAFEDDFPAALLGDERQRVHARHQQPERTENTLCREQPRQAEHIRGRPRSVQFPYREAREQEGDAQILHYH